MPNQTLPVVLTPSPKAYFLNYISGLLLSPLLIGLYQILKTERRRRTTAYAISNTMLTISDHQYPKNIDLVDITDIKVQNGFTDIGSLIIHAGNLDHALIGLNDPERIESIIQNAAHIQSNLLESSN